MNELDETRLIWTREELLGTVQTLKHRGRVVRYRMPERIDAQVTLRFKGYGRTRQGATGDLLLRVQLDRGQDVEARLWLPASSAASGCQMDLQVARQRFTVPVPPGSREGQVVRLAGAGKPSPFAWGFPLFGRKRGDLCVSLRTFPDAIQPRYGGVESLPDQDLGTEGWIYRRIDFVLAKLTRSHFQHQPVSAAEVADRFNAGGWRALAEFLAARPHLWLLQPTPVRAHADDPDPETPGLGIRMIVPLLRAAARSARYPHWNWGVMGPLRTG